MVTVHRKLAPLVILISILLMSCSGTETRESTGEYIDNSVITAKVKTALLQSPEVSGTSIEVETYRGRVLLSGFVDSEEQRAEAARIARGMAGVKSVKNSIVVK